MLNNLYKYIKHHVFMCDMCGRIIYAESDDELCSKFDENRWYIGKDDKIYCHRCRSIIELTEE